MATAAGSIQQGHGARFAAACDVLSRYVKAAAAATTTTPVEQPRPLPGTVVGVVLPLMPGADLSTQAEELAEAADQAGPAPRAQQLMTISYGGDHINFQLPKWLVPSKPLANPLEAKPLASNSPPRLLARAPRPPEA